MYACVCAAVQEQQVRATILAGAHTVEEIGERCGAGTGCGTCREHLKERIEEYAAQHASALPHSA